jgi:hypothetical protein
MLGFLKKTNEEVCCSTIFNIGHLLYLNQVEGCLPNAAGCSNHMDPQDPSSATVTVDDEAVYVQVSPHHSIDWTTTQIYGYPRGTPPPEGAPRTMDGFIKAYSDSMDNYEQGAEVMRCFAPEHVPVIANLSMEYGFFDGWYASIPGPTMVNRAYAASATSHGMGTNDAVSIAKGYPQKTMFRQVCFVLLFSWWLLIIPHFVSHISSLTVLSNMLFSLPFRCAARGDGT